jgi:hypothetical protein
MGCESSGEARIISHQTLERADHLIGWARSQDGLDCGFCVKRFGANYIQQKFHGGLQPGESDGGE